MPSKKGKTTYATLPTEVRDEIMKFVFSADRYSKYEEIFGNDERDASVLDNDYEAKSSPNAADRTVCLDILRASVAYQTIVINCPSQANIAQLVSSVRQKLQLQVKVHDFTLSERITSLAFTFSQESFHQGEAHALVSRLPSMPALKNMTFILRNTDQWGRTQIGWSHVWIRFDAWEVVELEIFLGYAARMTAAVSKTDCSIDISAAVPYLTLPSSWAYFDLRKAVALWRRTDKSRDRNCGYWTLRDQWSMNIQPAEFVLRNAGPAKFIWTCWEEPGVWAVREWGYHPSDSESDLEFAI